MGERERSSTVISLAFTSSRFLSFWFCKCADLMWLGPQSLVQTNSWGSPTTPDWFKSTLGPTLPQNVCLIWLSWAVEKGIANVFFFLFPIVRDILKYFMTDPHDVLSFYTGDLTWTHVRAVFLVTHLLSLLWDIPQVDMPGLLATWYQSHVSTFHFGPSWNDDNWGCDHQSVKPISGTIFTSIYFPHIVHIPNPYIYPIQMWKHPHVYPIYSPF